MAKVTIAGNTVGDIQTMSIPLSSDMLEVLQDLASQSGGGVLILTTDGDGNLLGQPLIVGTATDTKAMFLRLMDIGDDMMKNGE